MTDRTLAVADPRRRALAERVHVVVDAECDALFPHAFGAVLRVRTRDGRRWEHRVMSSRGGPGNPLSPEELETKFTLTATRVLPPAAAAAATAAAVAGLPDRDRVGTLVVTQVNGDGDD